MAWSVDYNSDLGFIQVVYTGLVTFNEFKEATNKVLSMSKSHKENRILIDDSKLEIAVSTTEIYKLPLFYDDVKANRRSRLALILPTAPQPREDVQFFVTVCRNRGWYIKGFGKRQEAIEWLVSNRPSAGDD